MAAVTSSMSSASAAALAAAISSKPLPSPLPTPQSAGFASALSPLPSAGFPKSAKTPLTPPPAYLDFLRIVDKGLKTPLSSSKSTSFPTSYPSDLKSPYVGAWPRQPQSARVFNTQFDTIPERPEAISKDWQGATSAPSDAQISTKPLPRRASDPPSATVDTRRESSSSASSASATSTSPSSSRRPSAVRRPSVIIPESPSTGSPSLMSPASIAASSNPPSANPASATTATFRTRSPRSATAAKQYYMSLSPKQQTGKGSSGEDTPMTSTSAYTPSSANPFAAAGVKRPFCVRHVITRTVTYTRPAGTTAPVGAVQFNQPSVDEKIIKTEDADSMNEDHDQKRSPTAKNFDPVRDSANSETGQVKSEDTEETKIKKEESPPRARLALRTENTAAPQGVSSTETWAIPRTPLVGDVPIHKRRKVL